MCVDGYLPEFKNASKIECKSGMKNIKRKCFWKTIFDFLNVKIGKNFKANIQQPE